MKQALALTPSKPTPHTTLAYTCTLHLSTRYPSLGAPDTCVHTGAHADPHPTPAHRSTPCSGVEASKLGGRQLKSGPPQPRSSPLSLGEKRQPWDPGARRAQEERLPFQTAPTLISWARERGVSVRFVQGRRCLRGKCDGRSSQVRPNLCARLCSGRVCSEHSAHLAL